MFHFIDYVLLCIFTLVGIPLMLAWLYSTPRFCAMCDGWGWLEGGRCQVCGGKGKL